MLYYCVFYMDPNMERGGNMVAHLDKQIKEVKFINIHLR